MRLLLPLPQLKAQYSSKRAKKLASSAFGGLRGVVKSAKNGYYQVGFDVAENLNMMTDAMAEFSHGEKERAEAAHTAAMRQMREENAAAMRQMEAKHAAAREPIAKSNKECRGPFGLPAQLSVPALGAVDTKASLLVVGLAATTFAVLSLFKRS